MEPDRTEVEIIERVIEIIHERDWCQRTLMDDDGRVCLDMAMTLAMPVHQPFTPGFVVAPMVAQMVRRRVCQAVGLNPYGETLSEWNDWPGRTVEEVVLALKRAVAGERIG
jgi:hypothetical protein